MGRLIPLAVAAALLLLAGASPGGATRSSPQRAAARVAESNAAFTCRVLQDTHSVGFTRAFGSYRRCVARHARPEHRHPGLTFTLRNLNLNTRGVVTAVDPDPGCRQSFAGCKLTIVGTASGLLGGTYRASWTVLWAEAVTNLADGFCAVATGTVTLTLPPLGTLVQSATGNVCEIGATGPNVGHTLSRAHSTVEAARAGAAFRNAAGGGSVSFVQKPGPASALGGSVSGALAFTRFTLTF